MLICLPQDEKDEPARQKRDKDLFRIAFLLELSTLGPLRADLAIRGKEISGRFVLAKEEAKSLVEESLPVFISRMSERGFAVHAMICELDDPGEIERSLVREIFQEEGHSISLIA